MPNSSQSNDGPDCRCTAHPCDLPAKHSVFCPVYKMGSAEKHIGEVAERLMERLVKTNPLRAALCRALLRIARWLEGRR